eukprot:TRINITY_DN2357_c3_g1_i2.p1 TRINITY_DN2357_c3_g1~~TRINITY_DN2357_c3_g1_i2.p1  ORF type:complete len:628 (+),score=119.12 TRINITY_DN2357_c3_g1_i2:214-2097(+)
MERVVTLLCKISKLMKLKMVKTKNKVEPGGHMIIVCCLVLLMLAGLAGAVMAKLVAHEVPDAGGAAKRLDPWNCDLSGGTGSVAQALVDAAWRDSDEDGDGKLSVSDLQYAQDHEMLSTKALELLTVGDENGDGGLDRAEFQAALAKGSQLVDAEGEAERQAKWHSVDSDRDGKVTAKELEFAEAENTLKADDVQKLLTADNNADGSLSSQEFDAALSKTRSDSTSASTGSEALGRAAWVIADKYGDNYITDGQLKALKNWAGLSKQSIAQLNPEGNEKITKDSFLSLLVTVGAATWSYDQEAWCCKHKGACLNSEVEASTSRGFSSLQEGLSGASKSSQSYDCQADLDMAATWSKEKKRWCCSHYDISCPKFACDKDLQRAAQDWSSDKKVWCCEHEGKGCEIPFTEPFDCDLGRTTANRWSADKANFCCRSFGKGCEYSTEEPPPSASSSAGKTDSGLAAILQQEKFDCSVGGEETWTAAKKGWCCEHTSDRKGCSFDCSAGYSNWWQAWSVLKKDWCCKEEKKGCPEDTFDCSSAGGSPGSWTPQKRDWCCQHENRGCAFDCSGEDDAGWSDEKKAWCCANWGVDCRRLPFDCEAGYFNWALAWSDAKKKWCCKHKSKGCESSA